jgi:hypothetical protein
LIQDSKFKIMRINNNKNSPNLKISKSKKLLHLFTYDELNKN